MVRQWKVMMGFTGHEGGATYGYGEELGRLVFVFLAALVTLSLFAAIIFFCADGVSKASAKASAANNHGGGSDATCCAGCGGTGCGGGCGGAGCGGGCGS